MEMARFRREKPPSEWQRDPSRHGERPERVAGYGEADRYRQDPRERSDVAQYRRRGFVPPDRREWRDETHDPGFAPGGAGEERFIGPSWQSGYGPVMDETGGIDLDHPDPSRGRRPHGPQGWGYEGLGYRPEPPGAFSGISPRGYRRSDRRILEDVCDRLTDDEHVDASHIEVRVEDCVVFLQGTVPDRAMKRRAEDLAHAVRGVDDVVNQLRLARDDRPRLAQEARDRIEPTNGERTR